MSVKLRQFLDRNVLSQRGFANLAGLHERTVWSIFRGEGVTRVTALKIERATQGKITIKDFGYEG